MYTVAVVREKKFTDQSVCGVRVVIDFLMLQKKEMGCKYWRVLFRIGCFLTKT